MGEPKIVAAILAGGQAARYHGVAKGELKLADGRTILGRLLAELQIAGIAETVIAANDPDAYAAYGCPVIVDRLPDAGPLAGIEAALAHFAGRAEAVLFLPCDLPGISAREFAALIAAHRRSDHGIAVAQTPVEGAPSRGGDFFWHPLCAIVHIDLHRRIERAIVDGERCPWDLWRKFGVEKVSFVDPRPFYNINSPQDLAAWLKKQRPGLAGKEDERKENG